MRVTLFGQARRRAPLISTGSTAGAGGALPATPQARSSRVLPIRDLTRCCRCSLSAPERTNNGGAVARVAAASGRRTSGPQQGTCAACSSGRAGQRGTSPCSCVHQHSGPVQRGAPTNSGAVPRLPRSSAAHAESPGGGGHPGPLSITRPRRLEQVAREPTTCVQCAWRRWAPRQLRRVVRRVGGCRC
jgi:hypothetical protein